MGLGHSGLGLVPIGTLGQGQKLLDPDQGPIFSVLGFLENTVVQGLKVFGCPGVGAKQVACPPEKRSVGRLPLTSQDFFRHLMGHFMEKDFPDRSPGVV
jgi:hypothetical protein